MKSDLLNRIGNPDNDRFRNKLYVFLVCLGISIIIWFLIVLSKNNLETVDFPITYGKAPSNLVLTNKPDSLLSFRLSSSGFELITLKYLTLKRPVHFDLKSLNIRKEGSKYIANISTAEMSKELIKEHGFAEKLLSVSPQSIFFEFSTVSSKKVPVKPMLQLSFAQQYQLSDSLILDPDSVFVIGAYNVIDTIDFVRTGFIEMNGINSSETRSLELINPWLLHDVDLSDNETKITFNVEKFTESTIEIPLEIGNRGKVEIKTFPEKVNVTFHVALKDYKRINSDMFVLGIDSMANLMEDRKLKVKIIEKPSFIKIIRIEPTEVEFLVLKTDD